MKKILSYLLIVIFAFVTFYACFIYYEKFQTSKFDGHAQWGTFGDYIGGIVGTIFGFLSVILLSFTFYEQRLTSQRQKFENKYYELIKLHRDNVAELALGKDHGKKVFILIIRELREALPLIKDLAHAHNFNFTKEELLEIAYLAIYYGTGPNSSRILFNALNHRKRLFIQDLEVLLEEEKETIRIRREFDFKPFEGHQSRLGHYFRHLFQTIDFVDSQRFLSQVEKNNYVKTVRAQLSNHEQALLFFNSLSNLGRAWKEFKLITKYELIKNLPQSFVDEKKEIDVKEVYPEILFEWENKDFWKTSVITRKDYNIFNSKFELTLTRTHKVN